MNDEQSTMAEAPKTGRRTYYSFPGYGEEDEESDKKAVNAAGLPARAAGVPKAPVLEVPAAARAAPDNSAPVAGDGARSAPLAGCLWTVKDAAAFLRKSRRWLFLRLRLPDEAQGSIPHCKLGRTPRFMPDDLRLWAGMGFPPAATFRTWKEADEKKRKKSS